MIDPSIDDLIQRELDGATTPEESAALQRTLAADSSARAHYERLQHLTTVLSSFPAVEAPPQLREQVRAALESRAPDVSAGAVWSQRPRRRMPPRPRWRDLAFAAGGAVAAAVLLVALGRLPRPAGLDTDQLGGTMGSAALWEGARTLDRQALDAPWVSGRASVLRRGELVAVELQLQPQGDVMVELRFDGERYAPVGFMAAPAAQTNVAVQAGLLRVDHAGRGLSRLVLRAHDESGSSSRIDLAVRGESGLVERSLVVRPAPGG